MSEKKRMNVSGNLESESLKSPKPKDDNMIDLKCDYTEKADGYFAIECHRIIDKEKICEKFCKPK